MQSLEVAPPAFLLQNIKSKMADNDIEDLRNTFAPLFNYASVPTAISFEQIMQKIKETDSINVFKKLHDLQEEPSISFNKIMARLRELGYFKNTNSAKIISFDLFKKIAAAAAVILFLIGGYFMLNKTGDKVDAASMATTNTNAQNTTTNPNNSTIDLPVAGDTVLPNNTIATNENVQLVKEKVERNSFLPQNIKVKNSNQSKNNFAINTTRKIIAPKQKTISINGENITVLDNDYLLTFASFMPDKLPLFLQAETPVETQITIDKYSYFNITDGMGAMMKKMYATKSTGAPTRSAKKQKIKLENWKKADSAYFMQNSNLNPLDPRDLGNLILNK